MDKEKTLVIFRRFSSGEIIALFPAVAVTSDGALCSSYTRLGQHGTADYNAIRAVTSPAYPTEYDALRRELESLGYRLRIAKRASTLAHAVRHRDANLIRRGVI